VRDTVRRGEPGELRDQPRDGKPELADHGCQPYPGRVGHWVDDVVPEKGCEEEGAERDGRAVQVELEGRYGQLPAERLQGAVATSITIARLQIQSWQNAQTLLIQASIKMV
jgi:formylglycine-generating enzyme required for sulfatase activity